MRALLTSWNLLGLALFLLGLWLFQASQAPQGPKALPLPAEEAQPTTLSLVLHRPDPPQGFRKETLAQELPPGSDPLQAALKAWSEALSAPSPKAVFPVGKTLVVDLPQDFLKGLSVAEEVYRLYSLAYTLLATFPQYEAARFLAEGKPAPGLAHLDLREPVRLP
ncbi:GerMN domain-containing protein [Thermus sp.]|uniref:GerMN domain-containing protein n=1 Tax=Thermus sp. TaxID=275 RepID=UPI00307CFF9C